MLLAVPHPQRHVKQPQHAYRARTARRPASSRRSSSPFAASWLCRLSPTSFG